VFENRVLRKIFVVKREEVAGGWKKLHNKGLSNLYSSPHVIRVIKSRRIRWAGHATCISENNCIQHFNWKRLLGRSRCR
jgi:hypothetical protein